MYEEEDALKAIEQKNVEDCLFWAEEYARHPGLLDGVALCSDYCFNTNPFFSPGIFEDLIAPYLAKVTKGYHDAGLYVIKHTDGNINPIVEQMVQCGPDALHSLDPQGGVDLKEIKQKFGDRVVSSGMSTAVFCRREQRKRAPRTSAAPSGKECRDTATFFPRPTASTLAWTCQDMS